MTFSKRCFLLVVFVLASIVAGAAQNILLRIRRDTHGGGVAKEISYFCHPSASSPGPMLGRKSIS